MTRAPHNQARQDAERAAGASDYLLPEGMSLAEAGRAVAKVLDVRDGRAWVGERAYYDTFDGRLHRAGLVAVWEDGWLALRELATDRTLARAQLSKPGGPLLVRDLPDGELRASVSQPLGERALLPLVVIRNRERLLDVLDSERKTVVRMRLQQPALGRRRLRGRIHAVSVRGYDKELRRLGRTLTGELGLEPTAETLMDEAVGVSGARPGGSPSKIDVTLGRDEPAAAAAASVLTALLAVIRANIPGTVQDLDPEFLHDLRVSVRKTRAVQRELRHVFEPDALGRFRAAFRWLQQATGDARDMDVYLLEFDDMRVLVPESIQPDLDALRSVLSNRRAAARRRAVRALRSTRTAALLADWSAFLGALGADPRGVAAGPDAERPIGELAGVRIAKVYGRMVKMGKAIGPDSPPADYHELRKQGKELRYLLELFGAPLFDDDVVKPMIKSLKALQDVLGRHQDREVQAAMLRSLRDSVADATDGSAALMAMGVLVERLEEDQLVARGQFASTFETFASKRRRRRVKETFE